MMSTSRLPAAERHRPLLLRGLACLALFLSLTGCRNFAENADEAWRSLDPVGHRRFHREKYYPNERRMGLRMPDAED